MLVAIGLASWEGLTAAAPPADPVRRHNVRIQRDSFGVPHISGATDADVGYGLAYANAEDDFSTIEEIFASVRGRAGAITGQDGAKIDFAAAFVDAQGQAAHGYETLSPATRALVEAYAAGLNRYAAQHPGEVRLRSLFPVTGRDVVAGFALRSPFFFGLDAVLSKLVAGKLPPRDGSPVSERGSNGFAVAARRSTDATTRLMVNSHQPWDGGVAWWEAVVHSGEGWDFAGALFPGAPYPLLGHNRTLGWTNTVNRPDLIDTYKLVLDTDRTHYRFDGKWLPLRKERLWLHVAFGPFVLPVPRMLYRSVHGPVIVNDTGAYAIRYAGFGDVRQVEAYYRLNKARDFAEWRGVLATQAIPATNFVYADAAGHTAMIYNARFPARAKGFDWRGVLPGDTSADLWTGYVPAAADPAVVDPKSGWVANSNNVPWVATAPADNLDARAFPPELGIETFRTNRMYRFVDLFAALGDAPIDRAALLRIKFDKGYDRRSWAGAWLAKVAALDTRGAPDLARAQALLRQWDWQLDGRGTGDALATMLLMSAANAGYHGDPLPDARPILAKATAFLTTHFGSLDPPLGQLLRIRRGAVDVAVAGGPETLRAIYSKPDDASGKRLAYLGDSYVMLAEWGPDGRVRSESISPYGAAITRPASRHFNDQAALFAAERFKPVWFEAADLAGHIERDYRP